MLRLLLADDHTLFRKSLKLLLDNTPGMTVAGEASNGAEVLATLQRDTYDVVLLDVSMPGITGADLIGRIRSRWPALFVIVLTVHNDPQFVKRKIQAGAHGYLTKDCDPEVLCEAIRRVANGGRYIVQELAEKIAFEPVSGELQMPHERLTRREMQIFELLVKGVSLNQIADMLSISDKTVSTHKARMMKKMGIESNAQLVSYGIKAGFDL